MSNELDEIDDLPTNHRFVMEYLVNEILSQRTPAIQDCLLKSSILDRYRFAHETAKPTTLFGLQITVESLSDDIGKAVLQLWQAGRQPAALALLLPHTGASKGLELEDGDTEQEYLLATNYAAKKLGLYESTLDYFSAFAMHVLRCKQVSEENNLQIIVKN